MDTYGMDSQDKDAPGGSEQWRELVDRYIASKLVEPDNPNRKRWVYQSPEYEQHHTDATIRLLQMVLGDLSGKRILDFGCGVGLDCINLGRAGAEVIGVDASDVPIQIARLRAREAGLGVQFACVMDAAWHEREYDGLICVDVVEHVKDPVEALKPAIDVLKAGGAFVLSAPNRWAAANVLADPHWKLAGVTLMPHHLASWYVTRVRRVIREYDVCDLIGPGKLTQIARLLGCSPIYDTYRHAVEKLSAPGLVRRGALRWMAARLMGHEALQRLGASTYALLASRSWWLLVQKGPV